MRTPPQIRPVVVEKMDLPVETVMPNGVPVYVLEGGYKGIVRFELLFKGGYAIQDKHLWLKC